MQQNLQSLIKLSLENLHESPTAKVDVLGLLSHVLKKNTAYIYSHLDLILSKEQQSEFQGLIARRIQGEPIAYILGEKEFWSLDFIVNKDVLIPRPETELLVETALGLFSAEETILIADIGTGSGAIACSLAHERANWKFAASDISADSLRVAQENAKKFALNNIQFYLGDACSALPQQLFDLIISNPPYIAENDQHLLQGDLRFEPPHALAAEDQGLAIIQKIIAAAPRYLKKNAYLLLEHGWQQSAAVAAILLKQGFINIQACQDIAGLDRAVLAQFTREAS